MCKQLVPLRLYILTFTNALFGVWQYESSGVIVLFLMLFHERAYFSAGEYPLEEDLLGELEPVPKALKTVERHHLKVTHLSVDLADHADRVLITEPIRDSDE